MSGFARNSTHAPKLARRQEQFLLALLTAPSIAEAARKCGIAEATARRWLTTPDVRERYQALRRQLVDQAMTQLQSATSAAVVTLVRNLKSESPHTQIRAALGIIEYAVRAVEISDMQVRLEHLEALVAGQQQSPSGVLRTMRPRGSGSGGGGGAS